MSQKISFSVIIPCHNEQDQIERCLKSLENQTIDPAEFEVVVVNNASTDSTGSCVEEYSKSSNLQIHLIHEWKKGVSPARHTGAKFASGEIFVFLDADNFPHRKLLEGIRRAEDRGYRAGVIKTLPFDFSVRGFSLFFFLDLVKRYGPRPFGKSFCLRNLYFASGGYNCAIACGENVEFLVRVKKKLQGQKRKLGYVSKPIFCSLRRFQKEGYGKVLRQWFKGYIGLYGKEYTVIR